jgi:hypothetical protein
MRSEMQFERSPELAPEIAPVNEFLGNPDEQVSTW